MKSHALVESRLESISVARLCTQIKDRHNGNLLIDDRGYLVHIDFGFMLSNSPGGVNFEAAPFKLTRELLEIMDSNSEGKPSEMFDYFKVGCSIIASRRSHVCLLFRDATNSKVDWWRADSRLCVITCCSQLAGFLGGTTCSCAQQGACLVRALW